MQNGKNSEGAQNFQPHVRSAVNQKTIYEKKPENEEFFKILNRLSGRSYKEMLNQYKKNEGIAGN